MSALSKLCHPCVFLTLERLRELENIAAISSYVHIRFLDLSNNYITDLSPLATLNHLLWLKARKKSIVQKMTKFLSVVISFIGCKS